MKIFGKKNKKSPLAPPLPPDDHDDENVVRVEGFIPCRRKPAKKTLKRIEKLATSHGCTECHQDIMEDSNGMFLYLQVAWMKTDFDEKTLERFTKALIVLCKDSKDFIIEE